MTLQNACDTADVSRYCRHRITLQTSHCTADWTLHTSQDTTEYFKPRILLTQRCDNTWGDLAVTNTAGLPVSVSLSRVCGVGSPRGNQMMRINKTPFSLRKIICCVKTTDSPALISILNEHIEFIGDCSRILRAHFPILIKSISIFPAKQIRLYTFQECR